MAKAKPVRHLEAWASLFAGAEIILLMRLEEMLAFAPCLSDPENVHELHQMRIAAKRLRYTMELFEKAFADFTARGEAFADAITQVETLQKHLGEIHDADVLAPRLIARLCSLLKPGCGKDSEGEPLLGVHHADYDAAQGLLTLCLETRDRRDRHYAELLAHWKRLEETCCFQNLRALLREAAQGT